MLALAAYTFAFITIGLWGGLKIVKLKLFPKEFLYICSLAVSLLFFYLLFFVYLANPALAHFIALGFIVFSPLVAVALIIDAKKYPDSLKLIRQNFLPPLLIIGVVFFIYNSLLYGCRLPVARVDSRRVPNETFCAIQNMPLDNGLPLMYGVFTLNNKAKDLVLDWSIADRPPLQIGATLPLDDLSRSARPSNVANYYNVFSIFLQLSWIAAVWAVFKRLKFDRRARILLFLGFSAVGFFYLNSIFVWPKLLATGLALAGITPYLGEKITKLSYRYAPVAAVLIALGLESHSSVIFTLVPLALILGYKLLKSGKINFKQLAIAATLFVCILAPWQVYRGSITTSDRLVKYHFADVTAYEDKRGTVQTIVQEYQKLSFSQWIHNKSKNVTALFTAGYKAEAGCRPISLNKACNDWKTLTFFSTFFAFEMYGIGFLFLLYYCIHHRLDSFDKEAGLLAIGSLLFWVIVMFHPGSTVVHQGSFLTMIVMFILLGKNIARSPFWILVAITAIQLVIFCQSWVVPFHYLT